MRISESVFNMLYPDLAGRYQHFVTPPPADLSDEDFERLYLSSKLWRLNNCYTVINKHGEKVRFVMNLAQHIVYAASRAHSRLIILKSRQQGISTFWLICFFDDAVFVPNMSIGLMAQGTDEAATLLERAKLLWDELHPRIKYRQRRMLDKDNLKEFSFNNNSKIFIRVSFRSTTLQRLHISEFGKIANNNPQRAKETKTGTLQALARGMTGVIESTAEGRNMFKLMWDDSVRVEAMGRGFAAKDFKPVFLSWLDDPDCVEPVYQPEDQTATEYFAKLEETLKRTVSTEQRNFWVAQRRELGEDIFQEYPATPEEAFTATRDGTFYNKLYLARVVRRGRVIPNLYDTNLVTDVFFDLGVDDYFVVGFIQHHAGSIRLVREYHNQGKNIAHYLDWVIETGIPIRNWVFPHDINARELGYGQGGSAVTRRQIVANHLRDKGIRANIIVGSKDSIADGIESTRLMLEEFYVDPSCEYVISCIQEYSKEHDEKLQVWRETPVHDIYSHGADMLRLVSQQRKKLYNGTSSWTRPQGAAI
jgi:hypothetical protein